MKNKKLVVVIVCILLIAVTVGVGLYVRHQQLAKETKGAITLEIAGNPVVVKLSELNATAFEGETVNGKGDRSSHSYRGIELSALLSAHKVDVSKVASVTVSSADQYTVELTGDEIREQGRVYIAVTIDDQPVPGIDDGTDGAQMVVFKDPNSKRNVRYLHLIKIISD